MRTLYETSLGPTVSFQTYTIRQLDLMPKSWNELLRHWRSGYYSRLRCSPVISITLVHSKYNAHADALWSKINHHLYDTTQWANLTSAWKKTDKNGPFTFSLAHGTELKINEHKK